MLIKPLITEKSLYEAANQNRYTFVVEKLARKPKIKEAVEKGFGVKVIKVQTAIMPGKSYRTGKRWKYAQRPEWKKAVVQLQKGQKIELFNVREAEKEQKK